MRAGKEKKINRKRKKLNKGRQINKSMYKVSIFLAAVFFALIGFLIYFLSFKAGSIINSSYNRRSDQFAKTVQRGDILSNDGRKLAYTVINDDKTESRIYPYNNLFAHVVGFNINGGLGLESSYNYYLLTSHTNIFKKISNEFLGEKSMGDSIKTTLDIDLQQFASDVLEGNDGAVICMNPDTGEIYAMLSNPDFDPNTIADTWESIISDENNTSLLNRATQGLYTPGSTFKIFTLYEFFLENPNTVNSYSFNCKGYEAVGDTTVSCVNGTEHGYEDLKAAFANSCNCAFGNIGLHIDLDIFNKTNNRLLFGEKIPIDIASSESIYSLTKNDTEFDIFATSIGQGNTLCSPLQLALVVSAIANDGLCMKPYLVSEVINPAGEIVKQFQSEEYKTLFSLSDVNFLKPYLREVVVSGTSTMLNENAAYTAYGKSGTAQVESEEYGDFDHSWFVGWAEQGENKLSVCVIIENKDYAGFSATYVTKEIFDYYFDNH